MTTGNRTRDFVDLDKRYVWHPFTQMRDWNDSTPLVIERGEGNYLIDTDGNRYLDGVSSLWVLVHGHGRPEILDAIRHQLDALCHSTLLGLANVPSARLAEKLVAVSPRGLDKVFYSDSGSTAVEIALKMAFQYWKHRGRPEKSRFVCLDNAYHGDTIGAVSVGGIDVFHGVFGALLFDAIRVPTEIDALEAVLRERAEGIAAMIVEPVVQGAAGMLMQKPGYLAEVARLCEANDVLLIADEVATGFGRTGTMFACEHEGVSPDLMCVAKGITGGYLPLAATLTTREIYDAFLGERSEQKQLFHGHTYTGNPLACAAALASLELFETEDVLARVRSRADHLAEALDALSGRPEVREIRQRGLMVGIELSVEGAGYEVCAGARRHGVIIRPLGDVVVLMPPLAITELELDALVAAVATALDELAA
jgi:adenosylmethionine-8-amino-7-oxononanoate aminotransferase